MKSVKAVIFDMDGVLIDSEAHWEAVDQAEIFQHPFTEEMNRATIGLNVSDIIQVLQKRYGLTIDPEFVAKKIDLFGERIYGEGVSLCAGVRELFAWLTERDISIAIGSSSSRKWIDMVVDRFGLSTYIHTIVSTTSDELPGKPNPDVYLVAMKKLGVLPGEVVIIEDSQPGFDAAKASGADVIAVPHVHTMHGDFSSAGLVVETLADERVFQYILS